MATTAKTAAPYRCCIAGCPTKDAWGTAPHAWRQGQGEVPLCPKHGGPAAPAGQAPGKAPKTEQELLAAAVRRTPPRKVERVGKKTGKARMGQRAMNHQERAAQALDRIRSRGGSPSLSDPRRQPSSWRRVSPFRSEPTLWDGQGPVARECNGARGDLAQPPQDSRGKTYRGTWDTSPGTVCLALLLLAFHQAVPVAVLSMGMVLRGLRRQDQEAAAERHAELEGGEEHFYVAPVVVAPLFRLGDEVEHRRFGRGLVMELGTEWVLVEFYGGKIRRFALAATPECLDLTAEQLSAAQRPLLPVQPVVVQQPVQPVVQQPVVVDESPVQELVTEEPVAAITEGCRVEAAGAVGWVVVIEHGDVVVEWANQLGHYYRYPLDMAPHVLRVLPSLPPWSTEDLDDDDADLDEDEPLPAELAVAVMQ